MAIGYGVWAAAPKVIGHPAPWDGSWPYYSTVLITASALVALLVPRRYAAVLGGAALGQIVAELLLLTSDQRFLMTWRRVDLIGLLVTLPGTWLGSKVRDHFGRAAEPAHAADRPEVSRAPLGRRHDRPQLMRRVLGGPHLP
jgi:hypothetical protein